VVWVINDWKNLGPANTVQILSDPGIPKTPATAALIDATILSGCGSRKACLASAERAPV